MLPAGVSDHDLLFSKKAADTEESDSGSAAAFPPMGTGRTAAPPIAQVKPSSIRRPKANSFQGEPCCKYLTCIISQNTAHAADRYARKGPMPLSHDDVTTLDV